MAKTDRQRAGLLVCAIIGIWTLLWDFDRRIADAASSADSASMIADEANAKAKAAEERLENLGRYRPY